MAEVLMFHHAQGLTPGMRDVAARLRAAGHVVHLPDLYDGRLFDDVATGVAHARHLGFDTIQERARVLAAELPAGLVYAGFSLGVVPAQMLAQTRPGAAGALLIEGCLPPAEFGGPWPAGVPVQIHGMDGDEFFAGDGDGDSDLAAARDLVASAPGAELFVYPGNTHLFTDSSLRSYDARAAGQVTDRVLAFLDAVS